jgi:hypothetical protein
MSRLSIRAFTVLALAVAIGLAFAVSPFASTSPDGLTRVSEDKSFADRGKLHSIQDDSPIPAYEFPGIENDRLAKGVAGFVGTLGVFAVGCGVALVLRRRTRGADGPAVTA